MDDLKYEMAKGAAEQSDKRTAAADEVGAKALADQQETIAKFGRRFLDERG